MRHRVEERMESYKKTFDVVICNDSDLSFVVELVKYIVEEDDYSALKEEEGEEIGEDYIVVPPSLGSCVCCETGHVLSVHDIGSNVGGQNGLPHVAVVKQFGFIVQQLVTRLHGELQQRVLHDGIHGASLLAVAAVDAASLIDVVACGSAQTVGTHLLSVNDETRANSFDIDDLRGANGFAQSAGNASTKSIHCLVHAFLLPKGIF